MNIKTDAFGYADTPFRFEWRPMQRQHTKEELLRVLDMLAECEVKAWWYSVSARGSYPLFKSKVLPYRQDADTELYLWLVKEAHSRGIALMSWEYLNTAPLLTAQHPQWRYKYFDQEAPNSPRDDHYVCHNSPYGELLKLYCIEVLDEIGFDGIWFDGCYLFSDSNRKLSCRCDFCRAKYREETGMQMPETINWNSVEFRRYMQWRYNDFTEYLSLLSAYVRKRKPNSMIVYNYFNRFGADYASGTPLLHMPMEAMIASESCSRPQQVLLQHKTLRALNENYPTEVWDYLRDAAQTSSSIGEPEPSSIIYHAKLSATAGGFASFGIGENPERFSSVLAALSRELSELAPYIGGKQQKCAGLVLSGATKDYASISSDGKQSDPWPAWQSVHGMHNLLNALHLGSQVLLENMLTYDNLKQYQLVVLSDIQCMDEGAAAAFFDYIKEGGTVLATGGTGTRTMLGEPRMAGVLDSLIGIEGRIEIDSRPILEITERFKAAKQFPQPFMISGDGPLVVSRDCPVLAKGRTCKSAVMKSWAAQSGSVDEESDTVGDAVLMRSIGKGQIIYISQNIGGGYAQAPSRQTRDFVRALLNPYIVPAFTTDAPANMVVTQWNKNDKTVFHLLNVPGQLLIINHNSGAGLYPEDFSPTAPVTIDVEGCFNSAHSVSGRPIKIEARGERTTVTIDSVEQHEAIVLSR
ncbi:MAG: beta-galactosidase trimerization domain-containing protein [Christensenellales bacterium]